MLKRIKGGNTLLGARMLYRVRQKFCDKLNKYDQKSYILNFTDAIDIFISLACT